MVYGYRTLLDYLAQRAFVSCKHYIKKMLLIQIRPRLFFRIEVFHGPFLKNQCIDSDLTKIQELLMMRCTAAR